MLRPPRLRHPTGDDGSVTLFVVLATMALMLAVGLVVDGGRKIHALQHADAIAQEAARAAGQAIQPALSVRGQAPRAENARAAAAARQYLHEAQVAGTVSVRGQLIEVTTTTSRPTVFLAAIGIGTVSASGTAQVRLVRGLEQEVP